MGWGCPRSHVPLTGPLAGWGRAGGDINQLCLFTGSGEHWARAGAWNGPKTCIISSPPVDFPRLCLVVAQESPKAAAVPLVPPAPSNASKPPILLHPKTLGWGCRYLGVLWGSITQSPGVRQTHSKGDPRAKDADRARLFSLAAFCCCIHGNTITRYIYIIYILLKLHNQCTKTGVHC